jgi:subtilisin-like proprotein convertase family protein
MSRVLKVFCSPAEQENLAGSYLVIERYEGFVLIDVADDTVAAIARRFLVEAITDQYTIRMENEHVVNPTPGAWTVQVIASNIPQGPQDFAMVVLCHFGQPLPEANPIEVEVSPKLGIPDNSPQGVSSTLHVGQSDSIAGVRVSADITHTCMGDLRVMLPPPTTRESLGIRAAGGSADNIIETYDTGKIPELANLAGISTAGRWSLVVADLAGRDVGKLDRWELRITPA